MFSFLRARLPRRWLRLGRFPRLCGVGICLLLAARSAAAERTGDRGAAAAGPVVLVAARTLPAGHILTAADLRRARWPAGARPAGSTVGVAEVVGRRLAGPLGAGEAITGTRLVGRDLAAGLSGDVVATAVPLADPHAADLVRPGDRVELLSTLRSDDPSGSGVSGAGMTVPDARVLAVLPATEAGAGAELVVAVPRPVAARIVRDEPTHVFTAVLAPP